MGVDHPEFLTVDEVIEILSDKPKLSDLILSVASGSANKEPVVAYLRDHGERG
jgi:hypothetical protein